MEQTAELEQMLREIATRRHFSATNQEVIKVFQDELEKSPAYIKVKHEKELNKAFDEETDRLSLEAKAAALAEYNKTKKDPIAGFLKRDKTVYTYTREESEAWAKENARYLFVFDEKGFYQLAKSKNPPPFVMVSKVPEIQLASDLSMYLVELPGETAGNPIKQDPIFSEGPAA